MTGVQTCALPILDDVSKELRAFLDYVAGKKSDDTFIIKLEEAVKKARLTKEWRREYMTLYMRDRLNIEKGEEKGEEKMIVLVEKLVEDKRFDDISMLKVNKQYRQKLYKEYNIN